MVALGSLQSAVSFVGGGRETKAEPWPRETRERVVADGRTIEGAACSAHEFAAPSRSSLSPFVAVKAGLESGTRSDARSSFLRKCVLEEADIFSKSEGRGEGPRRNRGARKKKKKKKERVADRAQNFAWSLALLFRHRFAFACVSLSPSTSLQNGVLWRGSRWR